jgi:hypothetical protein
MDLEDEDKRLALSRSRRVAEPHRVAKTGLLSPTPTLPAGRVTGAWRRTRQPTQTVSMSLAAAEPRYRPGGAQSGPDRASPVNAGRQLALQDSQSGDDACETAFYVCHDYAARLYDLGYHADATELYQSCRDTYKLCLANERKVQTDPEVRAGWTSFPPEKERNGGGTVWHEKGSKPIYIRRPLILLPESRRGNSRTQAHSAAPLLPFQRCRQEQKERDSCSLHRHG